MSTTSSGVLALSRWWVACSLALLVTGLAACDESRQGPVGDAGVARDASMVPDGCEPRVFETQRDVPYVVRGDPTSDAMTLLDIYPPSGPTCGKPVVVWVHGGAWRAGDKATR